MCHWARLHPTESGAVVDVHTTKFVTDWTTEHALPGAIRHRRAEAFRLAARLLNYGATRGLEREDIEEAIGADLEFYMFQAISKAMKQHNAMLDDALRDTPRLRGTLHLSI